MNSLEKHNRPDNDFLIALGLARLILEKSDAKTVLGTNFREVRERNILHFLFSGAPRRILTGFAVDVSTIGATVTPRGLDKVHSDIITERTAIGIRRIVQRERREDLPVRTTLTEYQKALLETRDGEHIPVVRQDYKKIRKPWGGRYKPQIQQGTDVIRPTNLADSLYVLSATVPSADGRGPTTLMDEITFSANGILSDSACSRPDIIGPVNLDTARATGVLTDYLLALNEPR